MRCVRIYLLNKAMLQQNAFLKHFRPLLPI